MNFLSRIVRGVSDWYGMTKSLSNLDEISVPMPAETPLSLTPSVSNSKEQEDSLSKTLETPAPDLSSETKTISPVMRAVEPTWPPYQLTEQEFEICQKAYEMGGSAWLVPYPHPVQDTPAEQVELGRITMMLENLVRHGLAVDISSAQPYAAAIEEAAGNGRTIRYFAFSTKGYMLFDLDPNRKPQ